jgi:type IV pilus assembly protein PilC
MSNYSYVAIDLRGIETRGSIDVPSQGEALKRIKDMGLFPTKILETREVLRPVRRRRLAHRNRRLPIPSLFRKVRTKPLTLFTRQLATLLEAGMPLLRSLRTLQEQAEDRRVRTTLAELALAIEEGNSFAEALELQSNTFNHL